MKKWLTSLVDKVLHRYVLRKLIEFFERQESDLQDAPIDERTPRWAENVHNAELAYVIRQQGKLKRQLERK